MKSYTFIYLDKKGNELKSEQRECYSLGEARKLADNLEANSMLNDLKEIRVKRTNV